MDFHLSKVIFNFKHLIHTFIASGKIKLHTTTII